MAPTLYMTPASPAVRAVQICANYLNIDLELKHVDITKGEQKSDEFIKLNPTHTIPVLVDDDGTTLWESHAINIYLLKKYANEQSQNELYPQDALSQALLHQIMHFESSVLFTRGRNIMVNLIRGNKTIDQTQIDALCEALEWLNKILAGRTYAIGDKLTLADFSLIATVSTLPAFYSDLDFGQYKNIDKWMKNVMKLPACGVNKEGVEASIAIIKSLRA